MQPANRRSALLFGILLALAVSGLVFPAAAQFAITEFMAANNVTLNDEDGANSDWIEIQNQGIVSANLSGWHLTDTQVNPTQWRFPATNLPPGGHLVVFASEKDRRRPGAPLHTNFKLGAGGEYLALVAPDGTTVVSQFSPTFPPQAPDVSYGLATDTASVPLLAPGALVRVLVPLNGNLGLTWSGPEFDDAAWTSGTTGLGYDRQTVGVNFLPLLGLNVETLLYPNYGTIYARVPFTVENPADFSGLTLGMKFEDGFIAYLNGQEIARSNAPPNASFRSVAATPRADTAATNLVRFDVSEFRGFLLAGTNVLGFHVMNTPTNSPDLLLVPQLEGATLNGPPVVRYFPSPTPGRANNPGVAKVGPVISELLHTPPEPAAADAITVTARLRSAFAPVAGATLHYRIMFGGEITVPFLDDGANGDGRAGDGVYGGRIPANAGTPGQMVRWYITAIDTTGATGSRYPPYTATNDSPAYLGTVIRNPALTNTLPVFHWFVQNVAAADTTAGTRASVYWNGEFYDNVFNRVRGATAPNFAKKPYKFDFNPGDHFRFQPGQPRVDELNLNSTHHDKSYVRTPMSYETYRQAGSPASEAHPVRVQQNNAFYSVAVFTEQVDTTFLERRGLDPRGALYKMFNGLNSSTSGVEKKTRRSENNSDLQELVVGLNPGSASRGLFLHDRFNLPALINHLAAGVLFQDLDRVAKNYYLYRDTEGTREWALLPWDKDLTFGLFGLESDCLSGSDDSLPYDGCRGGRISHPLFGSQGRAYDGGVNNLFDAVYNTPGTRAMFLRRLRTLMDAYLQPPGTPLDQRFYERRLDELATLLQPDAKLDFGRWRAGFGLRHDLDTAMSRLKLEYLDDRRKHLYQTHSIDNVGSHPDVAGIPHAQRGSPALAFGTLEFSPASSNQAQEFVELVNPHPVAVDISGWQLDGGVTFRFAPGTVVPGRGRIYISPDLTAFRARTTGPRAGQGLLVVGNYAGQLSARGESLRLRDAVGVVITTISYSGNPSAVQQFLRITELMYHPSPLVGDVHAGEEYEFIELRNISTNTVLDLGGVRFVDGVEFAFPPGAGSTLQPLASILVVKNIAAFSARHGTGLAVAGQYQGSLENQGERIRLVDAAGEEVMDFSFEDDWHPTTDGLGFSLVIADQRTEPGAWGSARQWRAGPVILGGPGVPDTAPDGGAGILVSEILSRADSTPAPDRIELFNPSNDVVDIGGWFLSDDLNAPRKFRIHDGTKLSAQGFLVLTEADFNPGGGGFAFSGFGDEVWLFGGDGRTNLTGYVHGFRFGSAENGVSFGRVVNGVGKELFLAQSAQTFNRTNSGPRVGPVVISEIHYHPCPLPGFRARVLDLLDVLLGRHSAAAANAINDLEFIELQNISSEVIEFSQSGDPARCWRLRGDADYDFSGNTTLAPGAVLIVVNFDPSANANALNAFRGSYDIPPGVPILGPYNSRLADSGARLELQMPGSPSVEGPTYVLVDAVEYGDSPPWPASADGLGPSLQRRIPAGYGDDPAHWTAVQPSPGRAFVPQGSAPLITLQPGSRTARIHDDLQLTVGATGSAPLRYQWKFNGTDLAGETNAHLELVQVRPEQAGSYQVLAYNDAGSALSAEGMVSLLHPPGFLSQPQSQSVRPGSNVVLSVQAYGTPPLTYQWRKGGADIPGAQADSLNLAAVQPADGGVYSVVVGDAIGSVASSPATLTILVNPVVVQNPLSQSIIPGSTVVLSVSVTNTATLPIGYRLRRNNVTLPATGANYLVLHEHTAYFTISGSNTMPPWNSYAIVVTNAALPAGNTSASAVLTYLSDSDADGLPDSWENRYFGSATGAAPGQDRDDDGLTEAEEYLAGTDPTDALSYLRIDLSASPGRAILQFPATSNRTYTVEFVNSVGDPAWGRLAGIPARATNRLESIPDPTWTSNRYYRVRTP